MRILGTNRKRLVICLGSAATALIAVVLVLSYVKFPDHDFVVKAYFPNSLRLTRGAVVRLAGVDIGTVRSVNARPELKDRPVEVVMVLHISSDIEIPNDAAVSLQTEGILGETFVEIDIKDSSGPPIAPNGILNNITSWRFAAN